jgi:hypothetical protein
LSSGEEYTTGFTSITIIEFVVIEGEFHPRSVAEIERASVPIIPINARNTVNNTKMIEKLAK